MVVTLDALLGTGSVDEGTGPGVSVTFRCLITTARVTKPKLLRPVLETVGMGVPVVGVDDVDTDVGTEVEVVGVTVVVVGEVASISDRG